MASISLSEVSDIVYFCCRSIVSSNGNHSVHSATASVMSIVHYSSHLFISCLFCGSKSSQRILALDPGGHWQRMTT